MNAQLGSTLIYSPINSSGQIAPDETSRLERSSGSKPSSVTVEEIVAYCKKHEIPIDLDADDVLFPEPGMLEKFQACYDDLLSGDGKIPALPPTTLPEKLRGASTIIALEKKNPDYPSYHGKVVAKIASYVGSKMNTAVRVIYLHTDINPSYRKVFQGYLEGAVRNLLENKGIAALVSSIGWDDALLHFDHKSDGQFDHFKRVTGFVVRSTGNDGISLPHPTQSNMASAHAPPLAVSVGAIERRNGKLFIAGGSSANCPTFMAPVANEAKVVWSPENGPQNIVGTSGAAPFAAKVLAMLNERYGACLSREQILFAVIATCKKYIQVDALEGFTPKPYAIRYNANAAGHMFNAAHDGKTGPAGFGLIDLGSANHLLGHMVAMTQHDADAITNPTEAISELAIQNQTGHIKDCLYRYEVEFPSGLALKTTLEAEFVAKHGQITVTSPSGTTFPMVMSQLPILDDVDQSAVPKESRQYGIGTSHAWTGEPTGNINGKKWVVTSASPIRRLRMRNHHFQDGDIIHKLNPHVIAGLMKTDIPDLKNSISLLDLKPHLRATHQIEARLVDVPQLVM